MEGGTKDDLVRIAKRMQNPKAKLMVEEALVLLKRAIELEQQGRQVCLLCKREVEGDHLVEHYIFHYTDEESGALLKALGTCQNLLRCPFPSCSLNELEVAELNLHLATEHDMLKKVLEVDAREGRDEVLKALFFTHVEEECKGGMVEDTEARNDESKQELELLFDHDMETLPGEENVGAHLEARKSDLEVGELLVSDITKKEMVDKKDRKLAMMKALEFIEAGGSSRKAAFKFDVPHESLRSSPYFLNVWDLTIIFFIIAEMIYRK